MDLMENIGLDQCPGCNALLEADASFCVKCGKSIGGERASQINPPAISPAIQPGYSSSSPAHVSYLSSRYTDGYRVAKTINFFGTLLKAVGVIIFVLAIIIGGFFFLASAGAASRSGAGILGGGIAMFFAVCFAGGLYALIFWIAGVLVSAGAQLLTATFDTAVNTSTFLNNDDRARIMQIPG